MNPNYLPYEERKPDHQYQQLMKQLLLYGVYSPTQQSIKSGDMRKGTYSLPFPVVHTYPIENGFPLETARSYRGGCTKAIEEIFAIINGVRNVSGFKERGCDFWDSTFEDPKKAAKRGLAPGDLGLASYAVLHDFPTPTGTFNQMQAVLDQIAELPHLKTHTMTTLYPPGIYRGKGRTQQVVTVPCHGSIINILILAGKLYFEVVFRSSDMPIGELPDRAEYAALWLAICHVTGYQPGAFSIVYLNPHYYGNQRDAVEELASRNPRRFPTMVLRNPPSDLFSFRAANFELSDYDPHPPISGIAVSP